ncbi:MAG: methyltransferase domain-containing protein [Candidatus Omnitrophica bacterium]|nr:methyltransferase domain-containing protein [Candidatus Omnitrophota bacterium]
MSAVEERPARVSELVSRYGKQFQLESGKSWLHVHAFVGEALRHGILWLAPVERLPYQGRSAHLRLSRLREAWLHTNNSCNLACGHCLVSSSPKGEPGLPTATWRRLIEELVALGIDRCYMTGGEPFVRPDLPELIRLITETHGIELIILTNATLFAGPRKALLDGLDRTKVRFQVSLDGSTSAINDPIRGKGSFAAALTGLKELARRGFDVTLTTVVTGANLADLPNLVRLAASSGARSQHLMWMHRRGRVTDDARGWFPSTEQLIDATRLVKQETDRHEIVLDNAASFELRANAPAGVKFDLGNAGWQSLCIYADGQVYPSAAFANHKPLWCGDATNGMTLEQIWRNSSVLQRIREASVTAKPQAAADPLRYLTGGGDLEQSYFFSNDFLGEDPYYPLYQALLLDAMDALTRRKAALVNRRSGYDVPRIFHAMGDGAVVCGTTELGADETEVAFLHSNCVLSFDVEKPRKIVQEFYGQAAQTPQAELCCPTQFDPKDVGHIPQDVIDRFYGCGSPVSLSRPQRGEVYVDLGCGAGIDCFIAAKHVGPTGNVIGVDMTDPMLDVARANQPKVALALGYDVAEFRKGYLETVPVEDKIADIVTSNCVINLSPDKPKVFAEVWRILKDHGRMVIADIVSDREVPPRLKVNERLWGECIVGALTEEQFIAMLEQAGFYGLSVLRKSFWKTVEGFDFYSVTVQGFKFEKTAGCQFIGQRAIYEGPFKAALDEEGHLFPRDVEIEICTDTAAKLSRAPYAGQFVILESSGERKDLIASPQCPSGSTGGCC